MTKYHKLSDSKQYKFMIKNSLKSEVLNEYYGAKIKVSTGLHCLLLERMFPCFSNFRGHLHFSGHGPILHSLSQQQDTTFRFFSDLCFCYLVSSDSDPPVSLSKVAFYHIEYAQIIKIISSCQYP